MKKPKLSAPGRVLLPDALVEMLDHPTMDVFMDVVDQITAGKGEQRHGHGRDFMQQDWVDISKGHGIGFLTGQSEKKMREGVQMFARGEKARARHELLGSIAYAAMAVMYIGKQPENEDAAQGCNGTVSHGGHDDWGDLETEGVRV